MADEEKIGRPWDDAELDAMQRLIAETGWEATEERGEQTQR